jgi:hypothetical protein
LHLKQTPNFLPRSGDDAKKKSGTHGGCGGETKRRR